MLSLSVFIFAYNEAETLQSVTEEMYKWLSELRVPYELIIIDDGSSDGTDIIANHLIQRFSNMSVIHHERNYGLGSVYKTAFANARCDLITFFFADAQFSPEIIKKFLPLIEEKDMILGYLPNRKDFLMSKILSGAEKILFRILFGPIPKFQGILMFRRKLLDELNLRSEGGYAWTILKELIIKASRGRYRITSVPIEMRGRMKGKSKVNNLNTAWANLKQAFILRRYI